MSEYFKQSLSFTIPAQLGRTTGYQMVEWLDCLSCIRTCCMHTLAPTGDPLPEHWQKRIDAIPNGKESIARIVATIKLWKRHTYPHQKLEPIQVQNFLWELTRKDS